MYKVEDLGGTSWKMTILNIRSLASLATIINVNLFEQIKLENIEHLVDVTLPPTRDPCCLLAICRVAG